MSQYQTTHISDSDVTCRCITIQSWNTPSKYTVQCLSCANTLMTGSTISVPHNQVWQVKENIIKLCRRLQSQETIVTNKAALTTGHRAYAVAASFAVHIFELQIAESSLFNYMVWIADDSNAFMYITQVWELKRDKHKQCSTHYSATRCHSEEDGFTFESGSSRGFLSCEAFPCQLQLTLFLRDLIINGSELL